MLRENYKRAFAGLIKFHVNTFKKAYIVISIILSAITAISILFTLAMSFAGQSIQECMYGAQGSILIIGTGIVFLTICVMSYLLSTGSEMRRKFIFPLNRKLLALGNMLTIFGGTLILLLIVAVLGMVEVLFGSVLSAVRSDIPFASEVTLQNFLLGFWLAFCYIVLFSSVVYFFGILFSRFKLKAFVIIGIFLAVFLALPYEVQREYNPAKFFAEAFLLEKSVLFLSVKFFISTTVLQLLSYISLRNMEVKV